MMNSLATLSTLVGNIGTITALSVVWMSWTPWEALCATCVLLMDRSLSPIGWGLTRCYGSESTVVGAGSLVVYFIVQLFESYIIYELRNAGDGYLFPTFGTGLSWVLYIISLSGLASMLCMYMFVSLVGFAYACQEELIKIFVSIVESVQPVFQQTGARLELRMDNPPRFVLETDKIGFTENGLEELMPCMHHAVPPTDEEHRTCAICTEDITDKQLWRLTRCNHVFHAPCADPWFYHHHTCPMCSQDVREGASVNLEFVPPNNE